MARTVKPESGVNRKVVSLKVTLRGAVAWIRPVALQAGPT